MKNILSIIALLLPAAGFGQATLSVDRSEIKIGDQIMATVTSEAFKHGELINADYLWPDTTDAIEVVSGPEWNRTNPSAISIAWRVAFFDTGWIRIPRLPLIVEKDGRLDTIYTNDVPVRVLPVLPDSMGLEDLKDIYVQPFNPGYYKKYIPHVLIAILLLAGIYLWLGQRKSKAVEAPPAPPPPLPEEWAKAALQALAEKKLWQHGEVKAHYTELTGILREYLERRYGIHAMEQTSDEIITQLKKQDLSRALLTDTEQLLSVADLIKFAKADPGADIHVDTVKRVYSFVEETKPQYQKENTDDNKTNADAAME
jgi:hypothetical protein